MSAPNLLSCQQETGWQDSEMTSANRMERKRHHQKRKLKQKCQGEKDVQTRSKQETLSRFKDDKRKPDQETVAASNKDVENSEMSRTKTSKRSRSRRASQVVRLPSYRLSFVFIGSSLSKLPSPGLPGLYLYNYT